MKSQTLIIIAGPTAVGKTAVAIQVAQHFNTVILSADSRQCYKELNIGVARPSQEELQTVPHYFIASHSIHDYINAAWYEQYALKTLEQFFKQHKIVVLCGGTGLYIKALLEGLDEIPGVTHEIRNNIAKNFEAQGFDWLLQQLQLKDPLFSAKGEMQNPQRMMRALEVIETTGQSILYFRTNTRAERDFNVVQIGLEMPREQLYERINKRVDTMMQAGLEAEVHNLIPYRDLNALQTVGYKEMFGYFDGDCSEEEAIKLIKQNSRHYAKRQMTWFKKQKAMHWIDANGNILQFIEKLLAKS